jgi:hypothetical protein
MKKLFANFLIMLATAAPAHAETQQAYEMKHNLQVIDMQFCVNRVTFYFSLHDYHHANVFAKFYGPMVMEQCSIEINKVAGLFGVTSTNALLADLQHDAKAILVRD